ncbi:hypothetical protein [Nonomuraea bangladeshensis]|uniref:hypothetical protein n=1 Tax=Nonomuraea bangladeshensis TaxID=404385 RepID=UPI003C2C6393
MIQWDEFADYHGQHDERPKPGHLVLNWYVPGSRTSRVRVVAHTCECRGIVYELCHVAGQGFVRRTDRIQGTVHETAWTSTTSALDTFHRILWGQAR